MHQIPSSGPSGLLCIFAAAFLLSVAGCLNGGESPTASTATSSSLATQTDSPVPSTSPPVQTLEPNPVQRAANLTDCVGALSVSYVPAELVEDDLPSNYDLDTQTGAADFRFEMITCNEVAVDGRNIGPASFAMVFVGIDDPTGQPQQPGRNTWYMFERRTDSLALADWFNSFGGESRNGSVNHQVKPVAGTVMDLQNQLVESSSTVYQIQGNPESRFMAIEDNHRYFFGPDPQKDYWDNPRIFQGSGAGAGNVQLDETSPAASILGGLTASAALVAYSEAMSRLFIPPQPASVE